jgi:hypothetical protein
MALGSILMLDQLDPPLDRHGLAPGLDAEVTVAAIVQRLRDDHAVDASESSVRRWIANR